MERLIDKYAGKMVAAGLCEPGAPLIGFLDADLVWNRDDPLQAELRNVFDAISINSLVFAMPAEPYRTMIDFLASRGDPAIYPRDCETRTFMHDLPLADRLNTETIVAALKRRKSLIVPDRGIVTYGIVSPEQAFIVYSSVCFAVFVAFFSEYLVAVKHGTVTGGFRRAFDAVMNHVSREKEYPPAHLTPGPFRNREDAMDAVIEAGRKTVEYELVDSFFGNVSCRVGDMIYISQTSSSLDELGGCIDPCPLDGSSCAGVTASSELAAHRRGQSGTVYSRDRQWGCEKRCRHPADQARNRLQCGHDRPGGRRQSLDLQPHGPGECTAGCGLSGDP